MPRPNPDNDGARNTRHDRAKARRNTATDIANDRAPQVTYNNGEAERYRKKPTSFHKGIPHDPFGQPDAQAFDAFVTALSRAEFGDGEFSTFDVALGPLGAPGHNPGTRTRVDAPPFSTVVKAGSSAADTRVRNWESPLAGHVYDLQGPDAGDLAIARAPTLKGSELVAEMADVYAMALLRDVPFAELGNARTRVIRYEPVDGDIDNLRAVDAGFTVGDVINALNRLPWFDKRERVRSSFFGDLDLVEQRRRDARFVDDEQVLTGRSLFRGSVSGAKKGPYVSQFLLIGSEPEAVEKGYITYGAQRVDQRVRAQIAGRDFMTSWPLWLDVQNGADTTETDAFFSNLRFISTPRDLATFVHVDQLYQAYLNACLLLLAFKRPFDRGFPSGGDHLTRGSFATFGGPHVLSLMTEVASRALKAVRRQKFQHHLRARPEQLAAMLTLAASDDADELGNAREDLSEMLRALNPANPRGLLQFIAAHNRAQNSMRERSDTWAKPVYPRTGKDASASFSVPNNANYLLPMAFPEGSPMHPAYGAGHATVAGACTTILKAFFEMSSGQVRGNTTAHPLSVEDIKRNPEKWFTAASLSGDSGLGLEHVYRAPAQRGDNPADDEHECLEVVEDSEPLTIEGELDKLAANISIGRNIAGVHYYTDYFDSLRMGERLAVGILQEQMATYLDPVSMRLRTFDDDTMIIHRDQRGDVHVEIGDAWGNFSGDVTLEAWWNRHQDDNVGAT